MSKLLTGLLFTLTCDATAPAHCKMVRDDQLMIANLIISVRVSISILLTWPLQDLVPMNLTLARHDLGPKDTACAWEQPPLGINAPGRELARKTI